MLTITKRPYKRVFSGNPVHYELTSNIAATDPAIFFELKLMFRPILGLFVEVHRWAFYPTAGVASFSIHDLLHSQLDASMPELLADTRLPVAAPSQSGQFYLEFREITPTDQNPPWDGSELDFYCTVIRGGINYFKWNGNNFWVNYQQPGKKFMTWQQSGRKAMLTETIFLGWLNNETDMDHMQCRIWCKVTYTDGTDARTSKIFYADKNVIYYVPAGATQWNLAALNPAKKIHYWDVWITELKTPAFPGVVSEVFRYMADYRIKQTDFTLHYRNSLGCLDSIWVRGALDDQLDYQFNEQAKTYTPDYSAGHVITPQRVINETREQLTHKGDLGHLGREEQDRIRDAHQQREVYIIQAGKWVPVNIVTKNFLLRSSGSMRFTMPIEFTLGYDGAEYYTPKNIDLGDSVFAENVCLATVKPWILISKDFAAANLPPGKVELTFVGTEDDPQDASLFFRYRIGSNSPWANVPYANLPLVIIMDIDQDNLVMDYQAICGADSAGKMLSLLFNTRQVLPGGGGGGGPVVPPPFPITITQISNTGTVGGTRQQLFEYTGVNPDTLLPADIKLQVGVYSVIIAVISDGTQTLSQLLTMLVDAVNATTAAQWNQFGSAPPAGTPGFKPVATKVSGSQIKLTLNYQNQFAASGQWI